MSKTPAVFSTKDRVKNPTFGLGTISHVDARYTTIVFDEHGTKKFLTPMVQLEHTTTPAPERPARAARASKTKASKPAR